MSQDDRAFSLREIPGLDAKSHVPLYAQLVERFSFQIDKSDGLLAGKMLPSESECTAYFKVSRPTVRQAMAQLSAQGLITRGRGRGTFVAPQGVDYDLGRTFATEITSDNRVVEFRILVWETIAPPTHVRQTLRLGEDETAEHVVRLRMLNGKPFALEDRYLPSCFRDNISEDALSTKLGISLVESFAGQRPAKVSLTLRATAADAEVAHHLLVKKNTPLLSSRHTYKLDDGTPVLSGIVLFIGDLYEFSFQAQIHMA